MLKTALIESNISSAEFCDKPAIKIALEIEDEFSMVKTDHNGEEGWLFVDVHNDRFWSIYSLTDSDFRSSRAVVT